jgi:neutral ceramidase
MDIGVGKSKVVFKKLHVPLFGYGNSEHIAEAIENDLHARAFIFRKETSVVAIVNLECWIISHHLKNAIVEDFNAANKESGLNMHNIMLSAQNTHSAPGGYSHYAFLNLTTGGFHPVNYILMRNLWILFPTLHLIVRLMHTTAIKM